MGEDEDGSADDRSFLVESSVGVTFVGVDLS